MAPTMYILPNQSHFRTLCKEPGAEEEALGERKHIDRMMTSTRLVNTGATRRCIEAAGGEKTSTGCTRAGEWTAGRYEED